jgi:hypothetical protein
MSAHLPNTMTWQRKIGVFSSVASADCHQQTRRAMEASRSECFSVVGTIFTTVELEKIIANRAWMSSFCAVAGYGPGETTVSALHLGAATNAPARFYRVRVVP